MKVILIFPKYTQQTFGLAQAIKNKISPIGIACVAGAIEGDGHEVKVIDAELEDLDSNGIQKTR